MGAVRVHTDPALMLECLAQTKLTAAPVALQYQWPYSPRWLRQISLSRFTIEAEELVCTPTHYYSTSEDVATSEHWSYPNEQEKMQERWQAGPMAVDYLELLLEISHYSRF